MVAVYDAGGDRGRSYIVMERLPGNSLADSIGRGPVDLAWLVRVAAQVLAAGGPSGRHHPPGHQAGQHLALADGRAKVADFGIARVVEAQAADPSGSEPPLTAVGLVVGTPAYQAPERTMGRPATPQSDLYSLGVVLYEAVTGTKPVAGPTPAAIAAAALHEGAQDPALLRPDADPRLIAVIGRAMAVDPAQRYATAAEMAADLRSPGPAPTSVTPRVAAVGPTAVVTPAAVVATAVAAAAAAPPVAAASRGTGTRSPTEPIQAGRFVGPPGSPPRAVGAALIVAGVLVAAAASGPGARAGSAAGAGSPVTASPARPGSTAAGPATTAPAGPRATGADPVAVALQGIVTSLAGSDSAAAHQLAVGLSSVAATTDPAIWAWPGPPICSTRRSSGSLRAA